ncbi:CD99 antigen isoform X2 [Protopterus annectens]|uniref:CD99 antigen isoform X2 n=1 Tax=Protopterus annectens TaxID=7888 RepID=UPI001CF9FC99|nr:CD99 antigen isoform X2 [Protopterus annectens]
MSYFKFIVCVLVFVFVSGILGQDFDLSDALSGGPTAKPAAPTKKPSSGGDLDLSDGLDFNDDTPKKPPVQPQPGGSGGKGLSDSDLADSLDGYSPDKTRDDSPDAENKASENEDFDILHLLICIWNMAGLEDFGAQSPGAIAGIVSAVAMALFGAASSYFAYQKKKLCFKEDAGHQENVLMENQSKQRPGQNAQTSLIGK